jgi:hypothetical protein
LKILDSAKIKILDKDKHYSLYNFIYDEEKTVLCKRMAPVVNVTKLYFL